MKRTLLILAASFSILSNAQAQSELDSRNYFLQRDGGGGAFFVNEGNWHYADNNNGSVGRVQSSCKGQSCSGQFIFMEKDMEALLCEAYEAGQSCYDIYKINTRLGVSWKASEFLRRYYIPNQYLQNLFQKVPPVGCCGNSGVPCKYTQEFVSVINNNYLVIPPPFNCDPNNNATVVRGTYELIRHCGNRRSIPNN